MKVELLEHTQNAEELISLAAKLCYSSSDITSLREGLTKTSIDKFIIMLTEMKHESPTEHVSFTFGIEGISRITEIQLVRHRIASYSIQSGRYVKRDNPEFILPPRIKKSKLASERFNEIALESIKAYNDIFLILMLEQMGYDETMISTISEETKIERIHKLKQEHKKTYSKYEKIAMEDARYVHLQSLGIKLIATMNARTLNNFFQHRSCFRAQWEINSLSNAMLKLCKEKAPILFKNSGAACVSGICPEGKMQCTQLKGKIPTNIEIKELIAKHYNK